MNTETWIVKTVENAKNIATKHLSNINLENVILFGLPEIDDRYGFWRVPLTDHDMNRLGEVVIDGKTSFIIKDKTTDVEILENKLLGRSTKKQHKIKIQKTLPHLSSLRNTIACGDAEDILTDMPFESVDLILTSPPYFNARPEYAEYLEYEDYLSKMKRIIHKCHSVLNEGRFFVINISPVLIRRISRNSSSKRIAVPFDFHRLFIEEGFDFMEDIIWQKPEGAGWATGRGRRFAADRNPLQYKPVPVTEYILVYRKHTDKLIDWSIRNHPNLKDVQESKITDNYEVTNIWKMKPAHSKKHPAIFPDELAEKVIKYYSFKNDVVMDPFSGSGTTQRVAYKLNRRFCYIEKKPEYVDDFKEDIVSWYKDDLEMINCINTSKLKREGFCQLCMI